MPLRLCTDLLLVWYDYGFASYLSEMINSFSKKTAVGSIAILGCGWLGERIGKSFLEKGCIVKGSSRNEKRIEELYSFGFQSFKIDIEELGSINHDFFDVDVLIVATTNKNKFAHQNLLKIITSSHVKKIFFISSTSVYMPSVRPITVHSELSDSPLIAIEKEYLKLENSVILRCGGLIGDNRQPGNFFKKGATIKNPEASVNIIHFKEVIVSINSLVEKTCEFRIYNLIEESQLSRYEYYSKAYETLQGESGEFVS